MYLAFVMSSCLFYLFIVILAATYRFSIMFVSLSSWDMLTPAPINTISPSEDNCLHSYMRPTLPSFLDNLHVVLIHKSYPKIGKSRLVALVFDNTITSYIYNTNRIDMICSKMPHKQLNLPIQSIQTRWSDTTSKPIWVFYVVSEVTLLFNKNTEFYKSALQIQYRLHISNIGFTYLI